MAAIVPSCLYTTADRVVVVDRVSDVVFGCAMKSVIVYYWTSGQHAVMK